MPLNTKHFHSTFSNATVNLFVHNVCKQKMTQPKKETKIAPEAPDIKLTKTLKQLLRICYLNTILGEEQKRVGECQPGYKGSIA
jgi:hypothetical protein